MLHQIHIIKKLYSLNENINVVKTDEPYYYYYENLIRIVDCNQGTIQSWDESRKKL
jgi:hypothetical protein